MEVEKELKSVVRRAGRGRLGPSVVDCPRSHSSGWCHVVGGASHRQSQGKSYVDRSP